MFKAPIKQLIINSASQVEFLKYDGSATYVDIVSPQKATDGFFLRGFLQPILFGSLKAVVSTTLIYAQAGAAGAKQVATFACNAVTGDCSSENFIIRYVSLKLSPTEYQNQPLLKHYQVSASMPLNATAAQVATQIALAITTDKNSPVTATALSTTVTITAKESGVEFLLVPTPTNRGGLITGTFTVTTAPTVDIGTYDDLKNINWAKSSNTGPLLFDQNAEYFPVFGQTYKSYRFITKGTPFNSSELIPSLEPGIVDREVRIWIANGLTAQTTMDLIVADANAAV